MYLTAEPGKLEYRLVGVDALLGATMAFRLNVEEAKRAQINGVPFRDWSSLAERDRAFIASAARA